MDEKRYHVRFGATCVTGYGDVMHTRDYGSFDEFFTALQAAWDKLWTEVYSADPASELITLESALPQCVVCCMLRGPCLQGLLPPVLFHCCLFMVDMLRFELCSLP